MNLFSNEKNCSLSKYLSVGFQYTDYSRRYPALTRLNSNNSGFSDAGCRDANHSDFCGIIPFFKANFRITISVVKIPQNNDFKMVPDKIKDVTLTLHRF